MVRLPLGDVFRVKSGARKRAMDPDFLIYYLFIYLSFNGAGIIFSDDIYIFFFTSLAGIIFSDDVYFCLCPRVSSLYPLISFIYARILLPLGLMESLGIETYFTKE